MLKLKCSKPCVFHIFHLSKAFSKVHFVLRGPIQNSANAFSSRRNTHFFFTSGKKVGNLYFEVTCACWVKLMRVSSLLVNLATSISEVVLRLRWTRQWLHYAPIGSFAPIANGFRWFLHGLCPFGQKRLASIFSKLSTWSLIVGFRPPQIGSWT